MLRVPTLTLIASIIPLVSAVCQVERPRSRGAVLTFRAASALPRDTLGIAVIGARPTDPKAFPANFYTLSPRWCSSTIIGPRVILTAAHCVGNGEEIVVRREGRIVRGRCSRHPGYATDSTADIALCALTGSLAGIRPENISDDPTLIRPGIQLQLTGFGCTKGDGSGGFDGVFRVGEAPIVESSQDQSEILTRGGTVLCFGDSGGPAYLYLDTVKQYRVQVSVNSRSNRIDLSRLVSLSTPSTQRFLREFSRRQGATICGIGARHPSCRRLPGDP
jgi:hypothetical protein